MRKMIFYISLIFFICFNSACSQPDRLLYSQSEVAKIEIVEVGNEVDGIPNLLTIVNIEDKDGFLKNFFSLKSYNIFTDPQGIQVGEIAVKIQYFNNDYQVISASGQSKYVYSDYYQTKYYFRDSGYYYFNEKEFEQLLKNYII